MSGQSFFCGGHGDTDTVVKKNSLFVIGEPRPKKNIFHVVSLPF